MRPGAQILVGGLFVAFLWLGGCRCEETPAPRETATAGAKPSSGSSGEATTLPSSMREVPLSREGTPAPVTEQLLRPSEVAWRSEVKGEVLAAPLIRDDRAYFTTMEGEVVAVNLEDGGQVWTFSAEGPFSTSPVLSNNNILAASHDGNLYALHPDTGDVTWSVSSRFGLRAAPASHEQTIYMSNGNGNLAALESSSGQERWTTRATRGMTEPLVANGSVFVASSDRFVQAFDGETGVERWHAGMLGPVAAAPVVVGDLLVVASRGGDITAFERTTGDIVWRNYLNNGAHAVTADEHTVVVACTGGDIVGLDAMNGRIRWSVPLRTTAAPALLGSNVLVSDLDGDLVLVRDGEIHWRFTLDATPSTTPLIAGDTILVGTLDSGVLAITRSIIK